MCVLFWGAHKSLAPRACTLLGVLGKQRSASSPSRLYCSSPFVSALNFATSPNSGVKFLGGFLRSEKTIFRFIFSGCATFSWFFFLLLRARAPSIGLEDNCRLPEKSMDTGLEHPEKKRTRTGTSGGRKPWTDRKIRGGNGPGLERPGLHKEEAAAVARNGKENMNKSNERWRGDTKRKSGQEGGEGDDRQGKKENDGGSGAKDWKTGAQPSLLDWKARRHAKAGGQAQGLRAGTSRARKKSEVNVKWTQVGAKRTRRRRQEKAGGQTKRT